MKTIIKFNDYDSNYWIVSKIEHKKTNSVDYLQYNDNVLLLNEKVYFDVVEAYYSKGYRVTDKEVANNPYKYNILDNKKIHHIANLRENGFITGVTK